MNHQLVLVLWFGEMHGAATHRPVPSRLALQVRGQVDIPALPFLRGGKDIPAVAAENNHVPTHEKPVDPHRHVVYP